MGLCVFFASVTHVFCDGCWFSCFLRRFPWEVFFATVVDVFATALTGGRVFLRRLAVFFCVGRVCFLRRWCFFATVAHVFATVGADPSPVLFSVGNPCFLRRWLRCFFASVIRHVFCDGSCFRGIVVLVWVMVVVVAVLVVVVVVAAAAAGGGGVVVVVVVLVVAAAQQEEEEEEEEEEE